MLSPFPAQGAVPFTTDVLAVVTRFQLEPLCCWLLKAAVSVHLKSLLSFYLQRLGGRSLLPTGQCSAIPVLANICGKIGTFACFLQRGDNQINRSDRSKQWGSKL